jgi:hypothetical protein
MHRQDKLHRKLADFRHFINSARNREMADFCGFWRTVVGTKRIFADGGAGRVRGHVEFLPPRCFGSFLALHFIVSLPWRGREP